MASKKKTSKKTAKRTPKPNPTVLAINICDSIIRDETTKKVCSFDFLDDPEEDIYDLSDGTAIG